VGLGRQLNCDGIIGTDGSVSGNHGHDTSLANQVARRIVIQDGRHQPWLKSVELNARISQSRELDDGGATDAQSSSAREREQRNSSSRNILPEVAGPDGEPAFGELGEELGVNQVHLPKIGLGRIARDARQMLYGAPRMRITFDAQVHAKLNARLDRLTEGVSPTQRDADNDAVHGVTPTFRRERWNGTRAQRTLTRAFLGCNARWPAGAKTSTFMALPDGTPIAGP
jgi:hypothetical protein